MNMFGLKSPVILPGDASHAYRDPAAILADGVFHLYYTYVDCMVGGPYMYVAEQTSNDLVHWSERRLLTPKDMALNFSSPGNVVFDNGEYVICFQTYCRENGEKYGNENSRLFTMRSKDLCSWSEPELLRVKGPDVKREDMGRMIDPHLVKAQDEWWCFFKQNGVSFSKSKDLKTWSFVGNAAAGENVCVVSHNGGYRMFSSPENGIRVMDSDDLVSWHSARPDLTFGQDQWDWAKGRLTAGFVLENRSRRDFPPYIMFFHATRCPESITFDTDASIGVVFSEDLTGWFWPGMETGDERAKNDPCSGEKNDKKETAKCSLFYSSLKKNSLNLGIFESQYFIYEFLKTKGKNYSTYKYQSNSNRILKQTIAP